MGDMADWHTDMLGGDWDEHERPDDPYVTCRCCGGENLHWQQVNGNWRLFDADDELHRCPVNPLKGE